MYRYWLFGITFTLAAATSLAQTGGSEPIPREALKVDREIFLQLDRDHDQLLSRDEARHDNIANAYFQLADSNGDNRLSETEYLAIAQATAFGPANNAGGRNGTSGRPGGGTEERLLGPPNVGDQPGPGTGPTGGRGSSDSVNGNAMNVPAPRENDDAFSRLDRNGDGVLSREEAQTGQITDRFREADRDQNGQISPPEYQAYVQSEPSTTGIGSPPSGNGGSSIR